MPVNPDFSDLFSALNGASARYLLVGGYAFSFHAEPRFTKDLDVWVEPTRENADAVYHALSAFGAPMSNLSVTELATTGMVVQLGVAPNRIDIVRPSTAWLLRMHGKAVSTQPMAPSRFT